MLCIFMTTDFVMQNQSSCPYFFKVTDGFIVAKVLAARQWKELLFDILLVT